MKYLAHKTIQFFTSKLEVVVIIVTPIFLYSLIKHKKSPTPNDSTDFIPSIQAESSSFPNEQAITTINRKTASVKTSIAPSPRVVTETVIQTPTPVQLENKNEAPPQKKQTPIILNIYNKVLPEKSHEPPKTEDVKPKPKPKPVVPETFAPYGRMIKCELVNTVDSSNMETPIIGLVMEPVYWNGDLIVPAGSEVHGVAKTDRLRERISSGNNWNIILPEFHTYRNGAALRVQGIALDREDLSGKGHKFGLNDGSFGLKGFRIKSNDFAEIKLFASTFIGAVTRWPPRTSALWQPLRWNQNQ